MLRIRNLFTENEYEAIKYEPEQYQKCNEFITEKLDLRVRQVGQNLHVFDLIRYDWESIIKPGNYIIRRISDRRMFKVISEEIFNSNFEVIS